MILFETERLIIKSLESTDKKYFAELFTNEKVLQLIPQKAFTESQIMNRFHKNLNLEFSNLKHRKCTCGIFEKGNAEMIGLSLFLLNKDNDNELGYRFRVDYWGKGYGTETTKGMLEYYFNVLKTEKVIADVNIENVASIKILNTFMKPVKDFYNERDHCTDRRFELRKNNWPQ
jgi:ribosomal-protein-alanine N-acetyltransferase